LVHCSSMKAIHVVLERIASRNTAISAWLTGSHSRRYHILALFFLLFSFLSAYLFFVCLFCSVEFLNYFETTPHCNASLALHFEIVLEMSQSLASTRHPTRLGHVWRIIIGCNTFVTSHLLIYNKHMVHENGLAQRCKAIEKYYKIYTIRELPNWYDQFNYLSPRQSPPPLPTIKIIVACGSRKSH
jgi:hypothetical protein